MSVGHPDTIVVTRDLELADATARAASWGWTQWCSSLGSALAAIEPSTEVLVLDAALDGPMARLLASLFVDRKAGRRAVVVRTDGAPAGASADERIAFVNGPVSCERLVAALSRDSGPHERAA